MRWTYERVCVVLISASRAQTYPPGLGEPINVILSGLSDPDVLGAQFIVWAESIGLSPKSVCLFRALFAGGAELWYDDSCLGQDPDTKQLANLGDGQGLRNQTGQSIF